VPPSRRTVLVGTATLCGSLSLAGCLGDRPDLRLRNFTEETHTLAVTVAQGKTRILDTERTLAPDEQSVVESVFDDAGTFEFVVSVDGGPEVTDSVELDGEPPDVAYVTVRSGGEVNVGELVP
jgi:hypothetical protein